MSGGETDLVGSAAYGGAAWSPRTASLRQEIGLGNALAIDRIEIKWPGSTKPIVLTDVPIDTVIRVVERKPGFETVTLPKIDLTGPPATATE